MVVQAHIHSVKPLQKDIELKKKKEEQSAWQLTDTAPKDTKGTRRVSICISWVCFLSKARCTTNVATRRCRNDAHGTLDASTLEIFQEKGRGEEKIKMGVNLLEILLHIGPCL